MTAPCRFACAILVVAALQSLEARNAQAAWPSDPTVNLPICTAAHDQLYPRLASDGAGGAIIAWQDARGDGVTSDIYAQRVNLAGAVQWTAGGVQLSSSVQDELTPVLVADGAGGAVLAWESFSPGPGSAIFAQRVNSAGAAQWTSGGVALSGSTNSRYNQVIASDGAGGAFVAWQTVTPGPAYDVFVQHVTGTGAIAPGWPADGVAASTEVVDKVNPAIISDGAGGAIVTWQTGVALGSNNIVAQRLNASGARQWGTTGLVISAEVNSQYSPVIAADGAGGAVIAWQDTRNITFDIYAQRVNAAGAPQWTSGGVALNPGFHSQVTPVIVADALGGAIVAWQDGRSSTTGSDIYVQRLDGSGVAQWTAGGVALCNTLGTQQYAQIATDGAHGAIVVWEDERGPDVYARRVNAAGTPQWTTDGVAISTASIYQISPMIVSDGLGGAIMTWQDSRLLAGWEVYAQNVGASGALGGSLASVPGATPIQSLSVRSVGPNPSVAGITLSFSLPADSPASLGLFDLGGRLIESREVGMLGAGTHVASFTANARNLAPGLYCVRLVQGSRVALTRVVMLR